MTFQAKLVFLQTEFPSCVFSPAPLFSALSPSLSHSQGFSVELLRGSSTVSIDLDVSGAGHNRQALYAVPGDVSHNFNTYNTKTHM